MPLIATGNKLLNMEEILQKQVGMVTGMRVADMGCGNGYNSLIAAKIVGGKGQVYAVDILKSCLATVQAEAKRHHLLNIKTVWSNIEKNGATQIPEGTIDVAMVVHTLYQVQPESIPAFLQETVRLLAPEGRVVIVDWAKQESPIGPPVDHRLSEEEVKQAVAQVPTLHEASGFSPGQYHYGLIYNKVTGG